MKVEYVPVQYIHVVWRDVGPLLTKSLPYMHGEVTLEQTRAYLADGVWDLLVATSGATVHGAMVVHIFNRPNTRVAFVQAVGGRGIISQSTFDQLKAFAARRGATTLECAARPSMARMLQRVGMQEKHRILGFQL